MKRVLVLWEAVSLGRVARRVALLEHCVPQILREGAVQLSVHVADEHAAVRSPNPFPLTGSKPVALVNVWSPQSDESLTSLLAAEGFTVSTYRVEESIYRDYGDNKHAAVRDWPDGQRSPGLTAVTFMQRPARLEKAEWIRRWHGRMSPVSEAIQPRTRYVRNLVLEGPSTGLAFDGIVEESFPSPRHITRPMLFYGATGPLSLVINLVRILAAVTTFLTLWKIQTVLMSEYFVQTDRIQAD